MSRCCGLQLDPVANHLLLRAHVVDQPLDGFGEIGHGGGGCPVEPPSVIASRNRSIDVLRSARIAAHRRGRRAERVVVVDDEIAHGAGKPILEIGIEAVLRLARLQVEEAQHERARQSEQR